MATTTVITICATTGFIRNPSTNNGAAAMGAIIHVPHTIMNLKRSPRSRP